MLLSKLLSAIDSKKVVGNTDIDVKGIAYDSRKVEPGFLFVAIEGFKTDGHQYIDSAKEKGAIAFVVQKDIEIPSATKIIVKDSRRALALLSSRFFENPSKKLLTIGITGTNGKTTTTYLTKAIFESAGYTAGILGTIQYLIGDKKYPAPNTTPESLDLQGFLKMMVDSGVNTAIMEVTSHALSLDRVAGIDFDVAVFTNLTQDHLDFHSSMDDYREAKLKLFEMIGEQSNDEQSNNRMTNDEYSNDECRMSNDECESSNPKSEIRNLKSKKVAIINIDDPSSSYFINRAKVPVIKYGLNESAMISATDINLDIRGIKMTVVISSSLLKDGRNDFKIPVHLKLRGRFNVYNALASFAIGYSQGIDVEKIKQGLESVSNVSGRFETVDCGQDFLVIVDYAHTPDALERVLSTAREVAKGKLITVFGCGGDRDRMKRPIMGRIASSLSDICIVTSDNPRTENPIAIINEILQGVKENSTEYIVEPDRRKAIELAISKAKKDDAVVIAGKGHENYQILGTTTIHFDDREEVVRLLGG